MTTFDQFFFSVFTTFKERFKKKANSIALLYISILQISLLFVIGVFFATFLNQMKTSLMTSDNAWLLFVVSAIIIHFKNWLKYNGKTRKVLNAKFNRSKGSQHHIALLLSLPVVCLILGLTLLKSF